MVKWYVDIKQDFALDLENFDPCCLLLALLPKQTCSVMGSDPDWFSVQSSHSARLQRTTDICCRPKSKTAVDTGGSYFKSSPFIYHSIQIFQSTFQCVASKQKIPPTANTEKRKEIQKKEPPHRQFQVNHVTHSGL